MSDIEIAAASLKAQRVSLGWSAEELARRARLYAKLSNDPIKLTQQSISGFETGRAKRLPRWLHYAEQALQQSPDSSVTPVRDGEALQQTIQMNVLLPSANALTQMFDALLLGFPEGVPRAELAEGLARRLPVALAQLQGPLFEMDKDESSVPASGVPPHATGRRARPSPPNS